MPERPARRRVLLVINPVAFERMNYEDVRALDSRSDLVVMSSDAEVDGPIMKTLDRQGLLNAGNVLIQNPFRSDHYADVSKAADNFALDKALIFSRLCQLLGASQVTVESVKDDKIMARLGVTGTVGPKMFGARIRVDQEHVEAFEARLRFADKFSGGRADVLAASELLLRHGLDGDPVMASLIDSRQANNGQQSRQFSVDLSIETERHLLVAAELKIPSYFAISTDVLRTVTTSAHYRIEYSVIFP